MGPDEVTEAFHAIAAAEDRYRQLLRESMKVRGNQAEISRRLNRSREQLRQDAMTDEERAAERQADLARKRRAKERRAEQE